MHDPGATGEVGAPLPGQTSEVPASRFPTAFTILFVLIAVVAALTWIIPAGQYERALSETLGREAPVPGTYAEVEPNPQGWWDVLMAPIAGLYDPATGTANAIDVAVFVLVIGGFLAVVTKTGAIDAGSRTACGRQVRGLSVSHSAALGLPQPSQPVIIQRRAGPLAEAGHVLP
jgi:uncharacterized ion transporter superfamily protein YfcC